MNLRSYEQKGIEFSYGVFRSLELPKQQEMYDYLFQNQSLCPIDYIYEKENKLVLVACEGNGCIEFVFNTEQITGHVDTSLAGPGFHRAAVLLLDQMKTEFRMKLILMDTSGFYSGGDFEKLLNHYIDHLFKALKKLTDHNKLSVKGELSGSGIQGYLDKDKILPYIQGIGLKPVRDEEILTPMGAFSVETIKKLEAIEEQRAFARDYFLWFEKEQDDTYEKNVRTYKMWNQQVDIATGERFSANSPTIGYRNGKLLHTLPRGWEITLPGAFDVEFAYDEEEQETYPVYFILEEQQIRILYSYDSDIEEWKSLQPNFVEIENGKYRFSNSFPTDKTGWLYWSGEIMMEGHVLVMEAEGTSEDLMKQIEKMINSIQRVKK